jgi:hypothetical protein
MTTMSSQLVVDVWSQAGPDPSALNDDAVRVVTSPGHGAVRRLFVALADGAGSTIFAGAWATRLVDAAEPRWLSGDLTAELAAVRAGFDPLASSDGDIDFILEDKWRDEGSAATLLVATVELSDDEGDAAELDVLVVGDSVVIVSDGTAVSSFAVATAAAFTDRPDLVGSRDEGDARPALQRLSRRVPAGSVVAFASDGLAKWMLTYVEREGSPALHDWLCRADASMLPRVDDDLTLVRVVMVAPSLTPSVGRRRSQWLGNLVGGLGRRLAGIRRAAARELR